MAKHRSDGIGRQLLVTDAFGHELPKCSVHHGRAGNAFESASTLQMALSNQQVTRGFGDLKHISQLSSFGHRMPVSTNAHYWFLVTSIGDRELQGLFRQNA